MTLLDCEYTGEEGKLKSSRFYDADISGYLNSIGKIPLLSDEGEKALAARVFEGDKEARGDLVRHNLRLVVDIAKRYKERGKRAGLTYLDLVQAGNIGLINAVDCFRLEESTRFSTYASKVIKNEISKALLEYGGYVRIPYSTHSDVVGFKRFREEQFKESGDETSFNKDLDSYVKQSGGARRITLRDRIISALGVDADNFLSLTLTLTPEQSGYSGDYNEVSFESEDDKIDGPVQVLEKKELKSRLERLKMALDILGRQNVRQDYVLRMRYGLENEEEYGKEKSLEDVSEMLKIKEGRKISRERVRQIEEKALDRLVENLLVLGSNRQ